MAEQADLALDDAPKVDAPKVDAPKVDAPKIEAKVDAPKADPPKVDEPKLDKDGKPIEAKVEDDKPIEYTDFTAPEGTTLDKAALEGVLPMFKEMKLSQEDAQKLVTFYAGQVKTAGEANAKAWGETIKSWQTALKADTEFGGAKLEETQSLAAKAIDAYGGKDAPEIREFMKTYGLGDHPAFARFLARAGRTVREDGLPRPNGGAQVKDARALYPNSNMN